MKIKKKKKKEKERRVLFWRKSDIFDKLGNKIPGSHFEKANTNSGRRKENSPCNIAFFLKDYFLDSKKKDIKRRDTYLSEYFYVKTVYSVEWAYVAKCW